MRTEAMRLKDRERAKRKHGTRAVSTATRRMGIRQLRRENEELAPIIRLAQAVRPKTRAECVDGPRPCPWVGCRHHMFIDVNPVKENGTIKENFPHLEPDELDGRLESCSLDVAEDGTSSTERIAELMNLTRERIRQIEDRALKKVRLPLLRRLGSEEVAPYNGPARAPRRFDDMTAEERAEEGKLYAARKRR